MSRARAILGLTAAIAMATPALAADPAPAAAAPAKPATADATEQGLFAFNYGIPPSPALTLLGQPTDKVPVSAGLKPFILQIPSVVGNAEQGQSLGLDVSPAWLLYPPRERSLTRYIEGSRSTRILYRTHVGLAGYEGIDDPDPKKLKPSRLAFGLSASLLDSSDPFVAAFPDGRTWTTCLNDADKIVSGLWAADDLSVRQAIEDRLSAASDENKALKAERVALDQERVAIEAALTRMASNRARARELQGKLSSSANAEDRAALAELVTGRLAAIDSEAAGLRVRAEQITARRQEISTRLAQLADIFARAEAAQTESDASVAAALRTRIAKAEVPKLVKACAAQANAAARYGASLDVGLGGLWVGAPGHFEDFEQSGWVAWAAYRRPLGEITVDADGLARTSYWMIGGSFRASQDELVATGIAATPQIQADVFDGWVGVERLSKDTRLALRTGYQWRDTDAALPAFERDRRLYQLSWSQRIGEDTSGMWLILSYGYVGLADADDETLSLSFAYSPPVAYGIFGGK